MTYNVFGGTLSLTQSINPLVAFYYFDQSLMTIIKSYINGLYICVMSSSNPETYCCDAEVSDVLLIN